MTDSTTTSKIDAFFDAVDRVVDAADRTFNGKKRIEEPKAKPKARSKSDAQPSAVPAIAAPRRVRFRIEEVTDANTGAVLYIVTDGATARCEFSSRATAQLILEKLEAST